MFKKFILCFLATVSLGLTFANLDENLFPVGTITAPQLESILSGTPYLGASSGSIVVVEYTDFQCPYCKRFHQSGVIKKLISENSDVKYVLQHFPLYFHKYAQFSAEAALCVYNQGGAEQYFSFVDKLFDIKYFNKITISAKSGIGSYKLKQCVKSGKYTMDVQNQINLGSTIFGINGTPSTAIINTKTMKRVLVVGGYPYEDIKNALDYIKN